MAELTTDSRAYPLVDADQPQRTGVARLNAALGAVDADVAALLLAVADMPGRTEIARAIDRAVAGLVDGAPEALDTLREIAARLADNDDAVAALVSALANKADAAAMATALAGKADAAEMAAALAGKAGTAPASTTSAGLMAASDKAKMDGVAEGATANAGATLAEIRAGTDPTRFVPVKPLWDAHAPEALTDAATVAVDMASGINFTLAITANRTLENPTNVKPGQSGWIYVTRSGSQTLSFAANWAGDADVPVKGNFLISYAALTATRIAYALKGVS